MSQKISLKHVCICCDYKCCKKSDMEKHLNTQKHKRVSLETNSLSRVENHKNMSFYDCSFCLYSTKNMFDYKKHLETIKHKKMSDTSSQVSNEYKCTNCNKEYNKYISFYHHKKRCNNSDNISFTTMSANYGYTNEELINKLFQENQELRNFMVEQNQEMLKAMMEMAKTNTNVINTQNTNNNTQNNIVNGNLNRFNINVFLNEKCKDAMNFSEFLDSIQVTRQDLENNLRLGFVNGTSKIILDNLKKKTLCERSLHCTDSKRETFYIKENDKWTKQEDHEQLNKAIQKVSTKSLRAIIEWKEETNDVDDTNTFFTEMCSEIMKNSMAGIQRDSLYPKIIKKIAKEVHLDKTEKNGVIDI